MEQRILTTDEFESLWQQAEADAHSRKLVEGYASWNRKRSWVVSGVAACMVGIAVFLPLQMQQPRMFDKVYCNRGAIADAHWADVATEMLTMEMS